MRGMPMAVVPVDAGVNAVARARNCYADACVGADVATAEAYEKGLDRPALLDGGLRGPSLLMDTRTSAPRAARKGSHDGRSTYACLPRGRFAMCMGITSPSSLTVCYHFPSES